MVTQEVVDTELLNNVIMQNNMQQANQAFGAFMAVYAFTMFISLIVAVIAIVSLWKIYKKAGRPGWASIVPIYNLYVFFDITMGKGILFLLCLVPCVNIVFMIIGYVKLCQLFGKSTGFAIGLLLLPYIFLPILAFGKSEFIGDIPEQSGEYNKENTSKEPVKTHSAWDDF